MTTTKKQPARKAAKKAAKKRAYRPGFFGRREIQPLAIAAKEAYDFQLDLENIDRGVKFDDWRRDQVRSTVGRSGLSDCLHEHFRPLMAHFRLLAGKDDEAFRQEMRTGKVTTNGAPDDTREGREKVVHELRNLCEEHVQLADTRWFDLLVMWEGKSRQEFEIYQKDAEIPWPGLPGKWLNQQMLAKAKIEEQGGPLREGYIVSIVRQKTGRPDLTLGRDIWAGLAERCTIKQLRDILYTMVNRISARQGQGKTKNRNKSQKTPRAKAARSTKTLAPRFP